ncbi:type II toxin-antitoxin system Phd/YefM family antitoxin [Tolypothrix sp. FACHB-123]|uniref:type II toxin-antitoxin system Phd/YefM family antitoxin n=1 Tax=Tolypothrix sp. FACHB-123 TaxID=2692868 RepID=UPI001688DA20|nr:type II toxin-antitoxin system Phd/YefM family antitoxin [Tolypothrix sp. FACHB-123]MBD2356064.1 type II toxin-antitoxin system Phd/YefM family antitoxin [Tolypothrix sp. FACHB-123]
MTITVNAAEATTKFAELLSQVLLGEEVVIAEQGIPLARLVPIANTSSPRIPGLDKGKVFMTPDFNEPLPEEILSDFENSHIV